MYYILCKYYNRFEDATEMVVVGQCINKIVISTLIVNMIIIILLIMQYVTYYV